MNHKIALNSLALFAMVFANTASAESTSIIACEFPDEGSGFGTSFVLRAVSDEQGDLTSVSVARDTLPDNELPNSKLEEQLALHAGPDLELGSTMTFGPFHVAALISPYKTSGFYTKDDALYRIVIHRFNRTARLINMKDAKHPAGTKGVCWPWDERLY